MSREIKFRAWDDQDKIMRIWKDDVEFMSLRDPNEPDLQMEFMQYTGLKDKNGVEIYEGDIIRTDHNLGAPFGIAAHVGEIVYQTAAYGIKVGITITDLTVLYRNKWKIEVIGNIYENPELLK